MELTAEENGTLRQYLLGQLTPERRTPLEERLLTEAAFHDELSIAEDDLIDRYLAGELPAADRHGFETHFLLAPERHKKLRFARALRRYVAAEAGAAGDSVAHAASAGLRGEEAAAAAEQTPGDAPLRPRGPGKQNLFRQLFGRRPALALSVAASLLLAVAVAWVALYRPAGREFVSHSPYAVTLTPGLTRGSAEPARIQIPAGADALRLRLELPAADYESYRAALLTAERAEVWAADGLRSAAGDAAIDMDVPASAVEPGDYQVRVSGRAAGGALEDVSRYTFRVVR